LLQVEFVKVAFKAERDFLLKASHCKQPSQPNLVLLLQPISDKITAAQKYREDHRQSALFIHLSAVSESVPALGWVAVTPAPAPYIKEMSDAGQFYTNRVLKDFKVPVQYFYIFGLYIHFSKCCELYPRGVIPWLINQAARHKHLKF